MKILVTVVISIICLTGRLLAQNAPVITAGVWSGPGSSVTIPVTAMNFTNMGSCNLKLVYDPSVARAIAVTKGPLMAGDLTSNLSVPGVVTLGWYTWPGKTLPDNTLIFNIVFAKVANGSTSLTWLDDGNSCVWSDGNWTVLNDIPTSIYYVNGSVAFVSVVPKIDVGIFGASQLNQMEIRILPNYAESGSNYLTDARFTLRWPVSSGISRLVSENPVSPVQFIPLSPPVISNGFYYQRWVILKGSTVIWAPGREIVLQSFSFTGPPCPVFELAEDICVVISGVNCTGKLYHSSAQQPVPEMPGMITGPSTLLSGATGQAYSINPVSNASTYTWAVPEGWCISAGEGTTSITVTAGLTGQDGNITVTAGNSCGTSPSNFIFATVTARSTGMETLVNSEKFGLTNFPNPFTTETTIRFDLPETGEVILKVYDIIGHEVAVLAKSIFSPGRNTVRWTSPNVPQGIYFLTIFYQGDTATRRISIF